MSTNYVLRLAAAALLGMLFFATPAMSQTLCGNGTVEGAEQCDDGNNVDNDGCSATCTLECQAHCDCPQGLFCYYGTCIDDPRMPVYCCEKEGCPPGAMCFSETGVRSRCAESETHVCETACDCGSAHACKQIPGYDGKRCVKDVTDPWLPGGENIFEHLGVTVDQGEDATYCCAAPQCHAGRWAHGGAPFVCAWPPNYPGGPTSVGSTCGGDLCMSALKRDLKIDNFGATLPGHGGGVVWDCLWCTVAVVWVWRSARIALA